MRIIDCNKREKEAVSLKVVTHKVKDVINGGDILEKYVEALIKGRNRKATWIEWYPLEEFKRNNPDIKIKG